MDGWMIGALLPTNHRGVLRGIKKRCQSLFLSDLPEESTANAAADHAGKVHSTHRSTIFTRSREDFMESEKNLENLSPEDRNLLDDTSKKMDLLRLADLLEENTANDADVHLGKEEKSWEEELESETYLENISPEDRNLLDDTPKKVNLLRLADLLEKITANDADVHLGKVERSREDNVYLAKIARRSEMYEKMRSIMDEVVPAGSLSVEELMLLDVAYRKAIETRRESWRRLSLMEKAEESCEFAGNVTVVKNFRKTVEEEIRTICERMEKMLDSDLVPSAGTAECRVFCLKMKGDYHCFHAEVMTGEERREALEKSFRAYESAYVIAVAELSVIEPIRLGLAANLSFFCYRHRNDLLLAFFIAKSACQEATSNLKELLSLPLRYAIYVKLIITELCELCKSYMAKLTVVEEEAREC